MSLYSLDDEFDSHRAVNCDEIAPPQKFLIGINSTFDSVAKKPDRGSIFEICKTSKIDEEM